MNSKHIIKIITVITVAIIAFLSIYSIENRSLTVWMIVITGGILSFVGRKMETNTE
ncbi:hypothetical protein J32TS6_19670 [Virgibacillus pantothenticus]|uniref:hypothetical protein n=1 Tax=Virgibacillus TaxID=84406 RepID=UPI000954A13A|nr:MULTISPECIES: hypothetical protein [Virgibacillus]MBS7428261.1 hypothetical protein [Virgibacillus sp. 19R1-5]MBU8565305.1 hypothetical protein [Virgibacillus pantothenticus]MBU8599475.1 hypothetical protein [Virgibacillus pantothenticus]MBU8633625.1 hypothetical protein [Virgibacillus pantothenticus]MBU8641755.1 hypothetical protein [Virgibacillus pantothenticus]